MSDTGARRTTLSDVAREAGVSLATASRAFNGSATRTVRRDLQERVLAAAHRLGYSPDANAQAMARGSTATLGLVVHDIADPYFSAIAAGATEVAGDADLLVTMASTQHSPERELAFVELVRRQRARALVIAGGRLSGDVPAGALEAELGRYFAEGGGIAVVGQPVDDLPCVEIANRDGAADLARTLHGLGYRSFAVLAGPAGHRTAADRARGFLDELASLGCAPPAEHVVETAFTRDGGHAAMRTLLTEHAATLLPTGTTRPPVVFAVNDLMAVGAMAAARDLGRRVPDDVAVAGFDDIAMLRDVTPALTTVRVPLHEIGETAARLALETPPVRDRRVLVHGEVVVRSSTPRV